MSAIALVQIEKEEKRDLGVDEGHWNLPISAHLCETTPWKHKMRM